MTYIPGVPHNGTDTSDAAAESLKDYAGVIGRRIWCVLDKLGPTTCEDLERITGMKHQTVSGRLAVLRDNGRVVDSGERRKNFSGRMAIVWRAVAEGEMPLGAPPRQGKDIQALLELKDWMVKEMGVNGWAATPFTQRILARIDDMVAGNKGTMHVINLKLKQAGREAQ